MADPETEKPARPRRLTVQVENTTDGLLLSRRNVDSRTGLFALVFLIFWTTGCVSLADMVIKEPTLFNFLFAIPFWASWVFVFFFVLKSFFLRDRLILSADGMRFDRQILILIQQRFVPLDEIREFEIYSRVIDDDSGACKWGIELENLGNPLRFFEGLDDEERMWLRHLLNETVLKLRNRNVEQPTEDNGDSEPLHVGIVEVLTAADMPVRPPTDCSWQRLESHNSITFFQTGKIAWLELYGLLFINLFWNCILSLFVVDLFDNGVARPAGIGWWGQFVFLIPFAAIGLAFAVRLLFAFIEPFRQSFWHLQDRMIEYSSKWFGLGLPDRRYEFDHLQRIELKVCREASTRFRNIANTPVRSMWHAEAPFVLMFVDQTDAEVCSISRLTEGEARWMADVVLRERPEWFR